jgi:hypothetical protein
MLPIIPYYVNGVSHSPKWIRKWLVPLPRQKRFERPRNSLEGVCEVITYQIGHIRYLETHHAKLLYLSFT